MSLHMQPEFVHLRLHSEYSLVDGLTRIPALMKALPDAGMRSVALTDLSNLFAAVKFYKAALANGIKPIIGCDLLCADNANQQEYFEFTLLCMNKAGYKNLTTLVSKAYESREQGRPIHVDYNWLESYSEGLIALSGARLGAIGKALLKGDEALAVSRAQRWQQYFPNRFYLELQRTERTGEDTYNSQIIKISSDLQLPLVATNDVRFLSTKDFDAHEARVCIHDGDVLGDPSRSKLYSDKQYLRTAEEMSTLFADIPNALTNTVEISKRCNLRLELGKNVLPDFPTPENFTEASYLQTQAKAGLEKRLVVCYGKNFCNLEKFADYTSRLERELDVINSMGFAGYFLIVADFIDWAKNNDVPVGPGRGSGAGSLVAFSLGITDIDPIPYDLLFERFLNPERVSMPDFDIDFCMEGRDRVIEYVSHKYGKNSVSQIITFGTMAAKAVVRDVGRVLSHPYGFVDKLAKLIPFELGMTLSKALEQEEELKRRFEQEEDVKELFELALSLEGLARNAGKHAGGVVIAPSQLTDFTAIYCEQGSDQWVSQYDKDDVEAVGLVKFDFLGLRTLTIIDKALKIINAKRSKEGKELIDITQIPTDDVKTFALLKACETTAVFQLESRGMKDLIRRLQPDCFEEIIALVALFRPGPLQSGMVDDFIDRKHGRAPVVYPHHDLEPILKPTYGVILYQEQVMQIAQVLANYTLGAADLLRRAMGKKKPEEMAKQRQIFIEGANSRGVDKELAESIFDLMEKFAGYGFNKSHSAAYALIAYQTAWLKAHFLSAFMSAVLSSDMDNTDKVSIFIDESQALGLTVYPPSLNQSFNAFSVIDEQTILYGLGAIKGVGSAAVEVIVLEREKTGAFTGLFDFCSRVDTRRINRRVLEALIKSGATDEWGIDRAILLASIDDALQEGARTHSVKNSGQSDLFGLFEGENSQERYTTVDKLDSRRKLEYEREVLGFYLTGHPASFYLKEFQGVVTPLSNITADKSSKVYVCGCITAIRKIITKRGKKIWIIGLDDGSKKQDLVAFHEIAVEFDEELISGAIFVFEASVSTDSYNGGVRLVVDRIYPLSAARQQFARCLMLNLAEVDKGQIAGLSRVLKQYAGACPVQINYSNKSASVRLALSKDWMISPKDELLTALADILGEKKAYFWYG